MQAIERLANPIKIQGVVKLFRPNIATVNNAKAILISGIFIINLYINYAGFFLHLSYCNWHAECPATCPNSWCKLCLLFYIGLTLIEMDIFKTGGKSR